MSTKDNLTAKTQPTWCPGCTNFMILEAVKRTFAKMIDEKKIRHEDIAIVTGIGCHAKIYDALNVSAFYGLHGRSIPTAMGIKLGNPNLKVLAFAGDGDTYSEGMEHFIHAGRYNSDITLVVHDNQAFALTTGQATPTSQQGYRTKIEPAGAHNFPMNPIKLALAAGATFVARTYSLNLEHCAKTIEAAMNHRGFSYVEVIQPCLQFNTEMDIIRKMTYEIQNNTDMEKAMKIAGEWDYNKKEGKIPIGIIYEANRPTLEDNYPQISNLLKSKKSWKNK